MYNPHKHLILLNFLTLISIKTCLMKAQYVFSQLSNSILVAKKLCTANQGVSVSHLCEAWQGCMWICKSPELLALPHSKGLWLDVAVTGAH